MQGISLKYSTSDLICFIVYRSALGMIWFRAFCCIEVVPNDLSVSKEMLLRQNLRHIALMAQVLAIAYATWFYLLNGPGSTRILAALGAITCFAGAATFTVQPSPMSTISCGMFLVSLVLMMGAHFYRHVPERAVSQNNASNQSSNQPNENKNQSRSRSKRKGAKRRRRSQSNRSRHSSKSKSPKRKKKSTSPKKKQGKKAKHDSQTVVRQEETIDSPMRITEESKEAILTQKDSNFVMTAQSKREKSPVIFTTNINEKKLEQKPVHTIPKHQHSSQIAPSPDQNKTHQPDSKEQESNARPEAGSGAGTENLKERSMESRESELSSWQRESDSSAVKVRREINNQQGQPMDTETSLFDYFFCSLACFPCCRRN